jgi:hypothetical protein
VGREKLQEKPGKGLQGAIGCQLFLFVGFEKSIPEGGRFCNAFEDSQEELAAAELLKGRIGEVEEEGGARPNEKVERNVEPETLSQRAKGLGACNQLLNTRRAITLVADGLEE